MKPDGSNVKAKAVKMYDPDGREMDSCPHASMMIRAIVACEGDAVPEPGDVMRMLGSRN